MFLSNKVYNQVRRITIEDGYDLKHRRVKLISGMNTS